MHALACSQATDLLQQADAKAATKCEHSAVTVTSSGTGTWATLTDGAVGIALDKVRQVLTFSWWTRCLDRPMTRAVSGSDQ